jgi:3-hydroxyacyl-[acyl-carrier-protein] dehydratase
MANPNNVTFDLTRILRILPHRAPFVLLDRVTDIEPRKSARALKCVTYNEPFFPGHFPGKPIFPGVLILEALAQLIGVLAYASEPFDSSQKIMYFMGIDRARFRAPVVPGDRMVLEIEVIQRKSNIWKCAGTAKVDEAVCAEAELLAAIVDREDGG